MYYYKTILVTLVSVGPLIQGDTDKVYDRRLICYDRILNSGECIERSSVFFTGEDAHLAQLYFGYVMELTFFTKSDGSKIMANYRFSGRPVNYEF